MSDSVVQLGEIVEVVMGQAPPGKDCNKDGVGTVFVKAGEFGEKYPVEREWTTKPLRLAKHGDVLVCVVGATSGKINRSIECAIGRSVAAVRPSSAISTEYLYHFLSTMVLRLRERSQGAAQGVITRKMLHDLSLSLPPLEEQRRIVEILDAAQGLIDQRKEQIDLMDQLVQSLFYEMFGDPVINPMGWESYKLDQLVSKITDGTHKTPGYVSNGVVFISAKNVKNNSLVTESVKYITEEEHKLLSKRCNVEVGDILLTKSGSTGSSALMDLDFEVSLFESLALIKYDRTALNGHYLKYQLNGAGVKHQYAKFSKGGTIKHLHLNELRKLNILVPPQILQTEFAKRVEKIESQKAAMTASLSELEDTFNALMQRAFKGEF